MQNFNAATDEENIETELNQDSALETECEERMRAIRRLEKEQSNQLAVSNCQI